MSLHLAARNTIIQLTGRVISTLLGLFALAAITRYLGQEKFGWYTTVTTYLQFFGIIADFGLTIISAQLLAEPGADEEKILSNLFTLRLLLSSFFFGLSLILIWFFPYPLVIKLGVLVMMLAFFFITMQNILMGLFQKHLHLEKVALGEIVGRAIITVGYFAAIPLRWGLLPILFLSVIGNAAQFAIQYYYSRSYVRLRLAFDSSLYQKIFHRSWPLAISIIFNLIYLKADTLILSLVRSQAEVGLYGAAYRIIDVLTTVPAVFMGIMLPLLTFTWQSGDLAKFRHYFRRTFDIVNLMIWPLVFGGIYLAGPLMRLVAGPNFTASGQYLAVLLLALLAIFFGAVFGHLIVALNKQRMMIWGYLINAVLSLIGYGLFIPRYGALAGAWVTVGSETLIMIMTGAVVLKNIKTWPSFVIFGKSIVASLFMLAVIKYLPSAHLIITLALGCLAYFAAIYLTGGVTKKIVLEIARGK